ISVKSMLISMLRVMVECKNVKSEKIAKYLSKLTDGFRLWIHDNSVYALFDVESLLELRELSRRLKHLKNVEFRFIKIRTLSNIDVGCLCDKG
ncbi:hypothetical protein KEJ25_10390, partial [Candidatus Bathyarchaeota archaeon]|nr:hypothetical protein [Candidatus Bathyarchaeota archaeon]